MNNKRTVLVIEDDNTISTFIATVLDANDYRTIRAGDGETGRAMLASHCPDLVLLDLGLPDVDGLSLLSSIREWSAVPVIIVSARGHENEKVKALDLGADDYITKPFGTSELLARIRTALRHSQNRSQQPAGEAETFQTGALMIDFDKRLVKLDGKDVHFSRIEYNILTLVAQNAGKVLTYDFIIKQVWGPFAPSDNQILRVNMANIRRKIEANPAEPRYILTEIGVGYRMPDNLQ